MAEFTGQVREPTKKKRARVEEILVWEEDGSSDEHKQKGFTFATAAGCLGAGLLAASGYLSYQMNLRRHIKAELARKPATTPAAGSPSLTLDLPAAEVERERLRILATSQTHMRKLARSLVLSAVLSTGTFAVACGLVAWAWDLKSIPDFNRRMEVEMPAVKARMENAVVPLLTWVGSAFRSTTAAILKPSPASTSTAAAAGASAELHASEAPQLAAASAGGRTAADDDAASVAKALEDLTDRERRQLETLWGYLTEEAEAADRETQDEKRAWAAKHGRLQ